MSGIKGIKGMGRYPEEVKNEICRTYQEGQSVKSLSKIYRISRYSIQSWCGPSYIFMHQRQKYYIKP